MIMGSGMTARLFSQDIFHTTLFLTCHLHVTHPLKKWIDGIY